MSHCPRMNNYSPLPDQCVLRGENPPVSILDQKRPIRIQAVHWTYDSSACTNRSKSGLTHRPAKKTTSNQNQ